MRTAFVIGRILLGLYYLWSGIGGLLNAGAMSGYAGSHGVPAPMASVIVAHVLLIVAGFSFLTGWKPAVGVACVVIFLVPVTLTMHAFWNVPDAQKQAQLINFTKNVALAACALMFLAIPEPWPASLRFGQRHMIEKAA